MKKAFNEDIDECWVDWAIEMMRAGFESDNLYILAGITCPYNQFELQELANDVLRDLHLNYSDKEGLIRNYAYFVIKSSVDDTSKYLPVLLEFKDICNREIWISNTWIFICYTSLSAIYRNQKISGIGMTQTGRILMGLLKNSFRNLSKGLKKR